MQHDLLNTAILRREHNSFRHPESKQAFIDYLEKAAASCTPGGAVIPRSRPRSRRRRRRPSACIPDAEFRSSRRRPDVHLDRAARRRRGGVGEGVLTVARPVAGIAPDPALLLEDAGLVRQDGTLVDGGVSLAQVAREFGTPAYVYNADVDPAAVPRARRGARRRAASHLLRGEGEQQPRRAAHPPRPRRRRRHRVRGRDGARPRGRLPGDRIVFSGVGKREDELRAAIAAGIGHVNVESMAELELLARLADGAKSPVPVGIRVNPDVTAETHPYISTGKRGIKFGVPLDQVRPAAAIDPGAPGPRAGGDRDAHRQPAHRHPAVRRGRGRLVELVNAVRADGTTTLRELDVGGGLGIRYLDEQPMSPRAYRGGPGAAGQADGAHALPRAGPLPGRARRACSSPGYFSGSIRAARSS